jgi:hypothetical protein
MMRNSLALTATVLALAWTAPANAQMCGAGQTTGSTASTSGGGMMCGMMGRTAADPMAERSQSQQGQQAGGCPCCRNMAMMQGGMMGGGTQRPSQQPSTPATPQTPSMPGMQETPQTPRPQP